MTPRAANQATARRALVAAAEHLDRLRSWAVPGDRAVAVWVGADQIGQQLGIPGVDFAQDTWWRSGLRVTATGLIAPDDGLTESVDLFSDEL